MDSAAHPEQLQGNLSNHCLLCFSRPASNPAESLININGEEGLRRDTGTLIRKYFAEEILRVEGAICAPCYQQLDNFHRFCLRIKDLQLSHRMKTGAGLDRIGLGDGFQAQVDIKEEKKDDAFDSFGSSAEVEGLNSFLDEQFSSQADHNGNGSLQNRLLDTIVNEFQASSINNGDPGECSSNHQFSKRMKRNINDSWQNSHNAKSVGAPFNHQELEFLDEELYEYDKPPDEQTQQQHHQPVSPMEELERLRKENEWLKQRNHQLVVRLREVHVRNADLLQINHELSDKLRSYDPNALNKPVPSMQHHDASKVYPMAAQPSTNAKHISSNAPVATIPTPSSQHSHHQEAAASKFISMCGAYTLDNGDVVVMDSVIPCRTMIDIDAIEPGEKYDLKFVSKLAVALWGHERLAVSSVTGRKSNNAGSNVAPSIQLEPEKLNFVKEKVYNRALLETNDRVQAMARFEDSRINRLLNIKIQNAKRKKNLNFSVM